MDPNINTRSKKMLDMIGIRLKKDGIFSEWKVETLPESVAHRTPVASTSKAGFIPNFQESDGNSLSSIAVNANEETHLINQSNSKIPCEQVVEEKKMEVQKDISGIVPNKITAIRNGVPSAVHTNENVEIYLADDGSSSEEDPFSSDDSMKDPNYDRNEESSSSTSSAIDSASNSQRLQPLINIDQNEAEDVIRKKISRKRKAVPSEWKRNQTKLLRNSGKAYKTLNKGQLVSERKI